MARGQDTRDRLIAAATAEFDERGYDITNSNVIARRAGFAPQTFYRHFEDKLAIFLTVYDRWVQSEINLLGGAVSPQQAAQTVLDAHRGSRRFRHALRQLAGTDRRVALARAASRQAQIARLETALPQTTPAERASRILHIERLADAIVDGEFADLGIDEAPAFALLVAQFSWLQDSGLKEAR